MATAILRPAFAAENFETASRSYSAGMYGSAARHWQNLAERGHGPAQYNIGLMHFYGQGVLRDRIEACKWFLLAKANGVDKGRTAIGKLSRLLSPLQIREAEKRARSWQTGRAH